MAALIMIAPGNNQVLQHVARQMNGLGDVVVVASANDVLWQSRQTPPRIVLADAQLQDMSGTELAEILPNFAPQTRILICGVAQGELEAQVQAVGAEFVRLDGSTAQGVEAVYRALDIAAPPMPVEVAPPREKAVAPKPADVPAVAPKPAQKPAPGEFNVAKPPARPAPKPGTNELKTNGGTKEPAPPLETFAPSGALVIQPQQYQVLVKLLELVAKEVGAECVLLIDPAGMILVQAGALSNVVLEMVGPLLATSFSTTGQLARHLQDQNTNASYIHEGDRYDIYAFNVISRISLIIMFDKKTNPGKLGTVWVYAKRAMRQLQHILKL